MNKSKIIFSTKGLYSSTITPLLIYIIACVCFFYQNPNALSTTGGYVITMIILMIFLLPYMKSNQMKKSYIDLYEDFVTGVSIPQNSLFNAEISCTFHLGYEDILNVEIQKDIVKVYFAGGTYSVQAKGVEETVAKIIREKRNEIFITKAVEKFHRFLCCLLV